MDSIAFEFWLNVGAVIVLSLILVAIAVYATQPKDNDE